MFNRSTVGFLFALLAAPCLPAIAAEPAAKPAPATWQITVKPAAASANAGGDVKLVVMVKNVSSTDQAIEVRQNFWYAHSNNPSIEFFKWPKNAGLGPVVLFKPMTLKPGETLSHDWTARIPPTAQPGPTKFRVGISLHRSSGSLDWSEPVSIEIASAKPAEKAPGGAGR